MPTPNPTTRREYKGAAAATTLQNSMTNTDTSFVLVAANNWPTGAVGKFVVTVNRGQADEEKILCDSQAARSVACQLANRGFDGTTAQAHSAGATVECTISAFDADEWNQHTNATTGVHGAAGAVVGTTDTQTLTNKTLNGATLDAASTIGGVSGTALSTAWTTYTPTFTNITSPTGAFAYKQIGKNFYIRADFFGGTVTATAACTISLPGGVTGANARQWLAGSPSSFQTSGLGFYVEANDTKVTINGTAGNSLTGAGFTGVIEVA